MGCSSSKATASVGPAQGRKSTIQENRARCQNNLGSDTESHHSEVGRNQNRGEMDGVGTTPSIILSASSMTSSASSASLASPQLVVPPQPHSPETSGENTPHPGENTTNRTDDGNFISIGLRMFRSELRKHKTFPFGSNKINLKAYGTEMLSYDNVLFPCWEELCSAAATRNIREVKIVNAELPKNVLDILGSTLERKEIKHLELTNANLGSDGFRFVSSFLKQQPKLETLALNQNRMDNLDSDAVASFAGALENHGAIKEIRLANCGLGNSIDVLSMILNALRSKKANVQLYGNDLKSPGAAVILEFLAANPSITRLNVDHNKFTDQDLADFPSALRSNTNLKHLQIEKNYLSAFGILKLIKAVYDESSLNAMVDCNHTCEILHKCGVFGNESTPRFNRRRKIEHLLGVSKAEPIRFRYLTNVPLKLIPNVIPLLDVGFSRPNRIRTLNNIFDLVRNCNMPVLFDTTGMKSVEVQQK